MSEMFYYIGILYIIQYLKTVYDSCMDFKKFTNETIKEMEEIQKNINNKDLSALKKGVRKNMFLAILGLVSVCAYYWWMIYGYLYAPESKLFLVLIIISIAFIATTIIKAVKIFAKSDMMTEIKKGNMAGGLKNMAEDIDNIYQMIFNIVNRLAKVCIAGYILYNHFFITI